jgi:DNA repair exonuclease SbcCD nuclease subunit
MTRPLRILHTADSHIGAGLPRRPRHTRPRRGDDFLDSYRRVFEAAAQHDVDLVVHAGDLFDTPRPSARALVAAAEPLLDLAVRGVPVVVVPGNHERSVIPGALMFSHPNIHIVHEPCTWSFACRDGGRVAVSSFPCLRRDSAQRFTEVLDQTGWQAVDADVRLLAVHETFESATCGPANYRFRSGDHVVERDQIPGAFHYVACGHVHRHQALNGCGDGAVPPVVYCGSPDRISFAELNEPKGFVLVERPSGQPLTWRFIEHDVRPMSLWPLDISGLGRQAIEDHLERILEALPPRAIAQLRLTGLAEGSALNAVRFTSTAWSRRPDVLLTVASRAVERRSGGSRSRDRTVGSPFDCLQAPTADESDVRLEDIGDLPNACGVYAMQDAADRLLYVGKAGRLRTRVRSHLGRGAGNFFKGWSRQIARVRVRLASSELEALLLEAELIRRLSPPFNRHMRQWKRYCYLVEGTQPFGQLDIQRHAPRGLRCYGPFRGRRWAETVRDAVAVQFGTALCPAPPSAVPQLTLFGDLPVARLCERHYAGACSGPCAERVTRFEYAEQLKRVRALLAGCDDSVVCRLEAEVEAFAELPEPGSPAAALATRSTVLRHVFDHAVLLAEAEGLMGAVLLLPGVDADQRVAVLPGRTGLQLQRLFAEVDSARAVLEARRRRAADWRGGRLPAVVLDPLVLAARDCREEQPAGRVIQPSRAEHMSPSELISAAFSDPR